MKKDKIIRITLGVFIALVMILWLVKLAAPTFGEHIGWLSSTAAVTAAMIAFALASTKRKDP